jgi:hypothetical protein
MQKVGIESDGAGSEALGRYAVVNRDSGRREYRRLLVAKWNGSGTGSRDAAVGRMGSRYAAQSIAGGHCNCVRGRR